jgi:ubiquinone/menaquinone biosynthesis C-methylase UbiE
MSNHNPGTDRHTLTTKAYADDEKLRIRMLTHEQYTEPKVNFADWVLNCIQWRGDELVLDVGAGAGLYFEPTLTRIPNGRYFAADLSMGMARLATRHAFADSLHILNTDVQTLPFPDGAFDIVMANHMLYHIPDLNQALSEIRRVLKPEGLLVAATNSVLNMPEFDQLKWRALGRLGVSDPNMEPADSSTRGFRLEDGTKRLHHYFFAVVRYDLPGLLVFPEVKPVVDYLNSMRDLEEPRLPRRVTWDDYMAVMTEQVQRLINHFGELTVTKLSGVLLATQKGGFIQDYRQRFDAQTPPLAQE